REAAAADAPGEAVAKPFEHGDLMVDAGTPRVRESLPVPRGWSAVLGEGRERLADLVEAQADLLRDPDERHPAQRVAGVAALAAVGSGRVDEALGFVEAQRRGGHAA